MYTEANMLKFMENRMQMHVDAEKVNAILPDCTERERGPEKGKENGAEERRRGGVT